MHKKNQVYPQISFPAIARGWQEGRCGSNEHITATVQEESTASIGSESQPMRTLNGASISSARTDVVDSTLTVTAESNEVSDTDPSQALLQYFQRLSKAEEEIDRVHIENLLLSGANINAFDDSTGATIMRIVACNWDVTIAQFLREKGINICDADGTGKTPLHIAASSNHHEMVEWLISQGADIEARTTIQQQTPVHYAARSDSVLALEVLIQNGGNYETKDYKGRTPLHLAAELDRTIVANFLVSLEIPADCTVTDDAGSHVITSMIKTMPQVAAQALNQLHELAPADRKQYYMLSNLEHQPGSKNATSGLKYPFEMAVEEGRHEILTHPVMEELIKQKWRHVRWYYYAYFVLYFLFLMSWSILISFPSVQLKYIYNFPTDIWRIVLEVIALGTYVHQIYDEVFEIIRSHLKHKKYVSFRQQALQDDLANTDYSLPEERKYLMSELKNIKTSPPNYFKDPWNVLDIVTYVSVLLLIALHVGDIVSHTTELAEWTARFSCVTVLLIWVRLLKLVRAMKALGPLVAILGELIADILRYLTLYSVFFIPYLISAWVLFGGDQSAGKTDNEDFTVFYRVAVVMFRMSLIDSYPYETMRDIDELMATILVISFLLTTAVVGLNLFIALLSDTFQRVYDNAQANALLEQAKIVLQLEDKVSSCTYHKYLIHIQKHCSPYSHFYDDDDDSERPTQLQKLTHQIHDVVTELQKERKEMEKFGIQYLVSKAEDTDSKFLHIMEQIHELKEIVHTVTPGNSLHCNDHPNTSRAYTMQQSLSQEQPRKLVPIQPSQRDTFFTRYKLSSNGHTRAGTLNRSTLKGRYSLRKNNYGK